MSLFIKSIIKPILRRVGTILAVYLASQGVPEESVQAIVNGLTIGVLISIDLMTSFLNERGK